MSNVMGTHTYSIGEQQGVIDPGVIGTMLAGNVHWAPMTIEGR